jgi:hypothetical protein
MRLFLLYANFSRYMRTQEVLRYKKMVSIFFFENRSIIISNWYLLSEYITWHIININNLHLLSSSWFGAAVLRLPIRHAIALRHPITHLTSNLVVLWKFAYLSWHGALSQAISLLLRLSYVPDIERDQQLQPVAPHRRRPWVSFPLAPHFMEGPERTMGLRRGP